MKKNKKPGFIKRRIRLREWLDVDRISQSSRAVARMAQGLLSMSPASPPSDTTQPRTFDAVQAELGLTSADLRVRQHRLAVLAAMMLGFAVFMFGYTGYQLFAGSVHACLVSLALTCVMLGFAFRYHFWYVQFKQRRLGLTLRDWFEYAIRGGRSS